MWQPAMTETKLYTALKDSASHIIMLRGFLKASQQVVDNSRHTCPPMSPQEQLEGSPGFDCTLSHPNDFAISFWNSRLQEPDPVWSHRRRVSRRSNIGLVDCSCKNLTRKFRENRHVINKAVTSANNSLAQFFQYHSVAMTTYMKLMSLTLQTLNGGSYPFLCPIIFSSAERRDCDG